MVERTLNLSIGLIKMEQAKELLQDLNSIEGVKADFYRSHIEMKDLSVNVIINFDITIKVTVTIHIALYLLKFLNKEKSRDNEPIVVECKNIEIVQGDSKEEVESKLNKAIEESK